jgi:hypothetical protein
MDLGTKVAELIEAGRHKVVGVLSDDTAKLIEVKPQWL